MGRGSLIQLCINILLCRKVCPRPIMQTLINESTKLSRLKRNLQTQTTYGPQSAARTLRTNNRTSLEEYDANGVRISTPWGALPGLPELWIHGSIYKPRDEIVSSPGAAEP